MPGDAGTERAWKRARSIEENHAFIMRVRISAAAGLGERRPQFSIEQVGTGRIDRFTSFENAAQSLAASVRRIVSGKAGEEVQT
jgi:hypothetical protein